MAIEDFRNVVKFARDLNIPQQFVSYEHGIPKDMPAGDGDRVIIPFIMGMRGSLTKTEARKGGAMWRDAIARYPKAIFHLQLIGYDQDPREIWEIVDAARYVRQFARAGGLDDIETVQRILGPGSPTWEAGEPVSGAIGFLAGRGVFGDELKQIALLQVKPTPRQ